MFTQNLIDAIRFPFHKEKELYRSFHSMLGFYPHDIKLYKEALMHKSMSVRNERGKPINNERLEFLGDAILDAIVGEIVFQHFRGKREGFLTNARSKIVQRETLGQIAVQIGLDKLIQSNGNTQSHNSYIAGNAFEALIGAIYLDRGYSFCMKFIKQRILNGLIDIDKISYKEVNFKSRLLEWSQKHKVTLEYELLSEERNEDQSPIFRTRVLIEGNDCGRGKGYSKKESQQVASKNALHRLRHDKSLHTLLTQNAIKNKA